MNDATLDVELFEVVAWKVWPYFAPHHYMSDTLNKAARGWVAALVDGTPVGFTAMLPLPSGTVKAAWRESRTVILPDFQGLGVGARLSDWAGEYVLTQMMGAYYSRTVHPRLGEYRDRSPAWLATSSNRKVAAPNGKMVNWVTKQRLAYSHRYIGYPEVQNG